jgi:hypothetical protein
MSQDEAKCVSRNGTEAAPKPDTEVVVKPRRRQYSAACKLRILQEYEASELVG